MFCVFVNIIFSFHSSDSASSSQSPLPFAKSVRKREKKDHQSMIKHFARDETGKRLGIKNEANKRKDIGGKKGL